MKIGDITIEALIDGETAYPGEFLYTNKEREDWKEHEHAEREAFKDQKHAEHEAYKDQKHADKHGHGHGHDND